MVSGTTPDEENVQLALRNPTDESVLAKVERKPAELRRVAAPAPQKPAFRHVTIIRGVKVDKF